MTFVSAAACSSTSSNDSPKLQEDYDDTAQAISSAIAADGNGGDVAAMSDSASIALGVLPLGFALDGSGEVHGNRFGVAYSYSLSCEDAQGNGLPACGPLTDRADVDVSWSGDLELPNLSAAVSRDGSWTIDGLQSDTAVFDGQSSFSFDSSLRSIFRPGAEASLSIDADASYEAVAVSTDTHDAIGGQAVLDVDVHKVVTGTDHDVDKSFSVHAELLFSADRKATLVLDDEQAYSIDFATGAVVHLTR
ncbi:MAG: hypothetical protein HOV81_14160 [Kofleriaceae bacterium]|nr:hypothetical protein [Kofleriaceae bacterium]